MNPSRRDSGEPGRVAIVVLQYGGGLDTVECLESLRMVPGDWLVVVVDNASPDGSAEIVRDHLRANHPEDWAELALAPDARLDEVPARRFLLLCSTDNSGYAGGNNLGIRVALRVPGVESVWLLNNDTVVLPDALDELQRAAQESGADLVGGSLHEADGRGIQACHGRYSPWSGVPVHVRDPAAVLDRHCYAVGASLLVRRRVFDAGIALREDFFLYCEDAEFCFRAAAAGFALAAAPRSVVVHKDGASSTSETKEYYFVRNSLRLHWERGPRPLAIWYLAHYILARKVVSRLLQGRPLVAAAAWRGLRDWMAGKGGRR